MDQWHTRSVDETLAGLGTRRQGLTRAEAAARLKQYGSNELATAKPEPLPLIFLRQFLNPLVYVLIIAAMAVVALGQVTDGYVIAAVLLINSIAGAVQEGRAQNTLRALRKFVQTSAVVVREGRELTVPDTQVVPGDILILREGERVVADARVLEEQGLRADESMLTGESVPVEKTTEPVPRAEVPLADRRSMVFKGTVIAAGQATVVAVATGVSTVVGGISRQVALLHTEVPLRRQMRQLSRVIVIATVLVSAFLFGGGLLQGRAVPEMLAIVISFAVSIIPEGLPVVVTLVLATGVWRMARRKALVRKLQAVQALGRVDIIAVDKTGTITRNELIARRVHTGQREFEVGGEGYSPVGEIVADGAPAGEDERLLELGRVAALTATAHIAYDEAEKAYRVLGDPTEAALEVLARKMGVTDGYRATRLDEVPFGKHRYRAVLHRQPGGPNLVAAAGAPEAVAALCRGADWAKPVFERWAEGGMRIIAIASARTDAGTLDPKRLPRLDLIGLVGMQDDMRSEVPDAVRQCQAAGVRVAMITGDHPLAARAIAEKAGIFRPGDDMLTGAEVEAATAADFEALVGGVSVFARVTPEQKLKIIQAWRSQGLVVAMTGDGVNDAPTLVAADLGVAMGRSGTEVAKEAADLVLLDDNLSSIVAAIEEGRSVFKTIKKVILYLFSTSVGEVLTIVGALLLGWPLPLLAAQIVWLNLVTDGFPDVALAMDPKEPNLLRPEFKSSGGLVDRLMVQRLIVMALPMAIGTLWVFSHYLNNGDLARGMTMALVTLAAFQWFNAFNCRFIRKSVFVMDWRGNYYLLAAVAASVGLQVLAVHTPVLQRLLRTVPLSGAEWALACGVALSVVMVEEVRKAIARRVRLSVPAGL